MYVPVVVGVGRQRTIRRGTERPAVEVTKFDMHTLLAEFILSHTEAILGVHTRGKPLADDNDLNQLARQTAGLTGADLANICNEAAIFAGISSGSATARAAGATLRRSSGSW